MINTFIGMLGISASDPIITYICAIAGVILAVCLAYSFIDFIFELIFVFIGKRRK